MVKQIGKGGFSSVYKYQSVLTGQYVAVKIMQASDEQDFEFKVKEIEIMLKLQKYPSVIRILNFVFHKEVEKTYRESVSEPNTVMSNSVIYVVMELAEGTLSQVVKKN